MIKWIKDTFNSIQFDIFTRIKDVYKYLKKYVFKQ